MADRRSVDPSAPPLERAILQAAAEETVPADVRRRALDALGLMTIAPTAAAAASTSSGNAAGAHAGAHVWWQSGLAKGLLALGLGGAAVGGVVLRKPAATPAPAHTAPMAAPPRAAAPPRLPAPPVAHSEAAEVERAERGQPDPGVGPERAGVPLRKAHPVAALSPSAAAKARGIALRDEIAFLDRARAALANGATRSALSTLDEYATRHPQGELRQEAAAVREQALRAPPH